MVMSPAPDPAAPPAPGERLLPVLLAPPLATTTFVFQVVSPPSPPSVPPPPAVPPAPTLYETPSMLDLPVTSFSENAPPPAPPVLPLVLQPPEPPPPPTHWISAALVSLCAVKVPLPVVVRY